MIDDTTLFDFCSKCASQYCKRYGRRSDYDDAYQDAVVYLLEHREKWVQDAGVLMKRVIGELIRGYQKSHGLRLKRRAHRVFIDLSRVSRQIPEVMNLIEVEESRRRRLVERALGQPDISRYRPLLESVLSGEHKGATARRYGITEGRLSQILKQFRSACLRLSEAGRVEIVGPQELDLDAESKSRHPLFYAEVSED